MQRQTENREDPGQTSEGQEGEMPQKSATGSSPAQVSSARLPANRSWTDKSCFQTPGHRRTESGPSGSHRKLHPFYMAPLSWGDFRALTDLATVKFEMRDTQQHRETKTSDSEGTDYGPREQVETGNL